MANTALFLLETSKLTPVPQEQIVISVFIDTGSQATNTIFSRISFTPDTLQFIDNDFNGSFYPNIVERQTTDNILKLTSFTTTPYSQNHGLYVRLKFKTLKAGEAKITISSDSKIHANDGKGTNIADTAKLPTVLTFFIGENKEPVITRGGVGGMSTTITTTEKAVLTQANQNNNVLNEAEKGDTVTDYSTLAECPKITAPTCSASDCQAISPLASFWPYMLLLIGILLIVILGLSMKLTKQSQK